MPARAAWPGPVRRHRGRRRRRHGRQRRAAGTVGTAGTGGSPGTAGTGGDPSGFGGYGRVTAGTGGTAGHRRRGQGWQRAEPAGGAGRGQLFGPELLRRMLQQHRPAFGCGRPPNVELGARRARRGGCQICSTTASAASTRRRAGRSSLSAAQLDPDNNWDRTIGDLGGSAPDPFCEYENPAGQVSSTTAGVTDTLIDTYNPIWNQVITPPGATVSAATLMANSPTWQIWVGDDDNCSGPGVPRRGRLHDPPDDHGDPAAHRSAHRQQPPAVRFGDDQLRLPVPLSAD